jgi:hypothetical protein
MTKQDGVVHWDRYKFTLFRESADTEDSIIIGFNEDELVLQVVRVHKGFLSPEMENIAIDGLTRRDCRVLITALQTYMERIEE